MKTFCLIIVEFVKFAAKEFGLLYLGFLCGAFSVACYAKFGFSETLSVILPDMALIFVGGLIGAVLGVIILFFRDVLREQLRSRQELVEHEYNIFFFGVKISRVVLHVPREWFSLPLEEHHRRVVAQLKGQLPF